MEGYFLVMSQHKKPITIAELYNEMDILIAERNKISKSFLYWLFGFNTSKVYNLNMEINKLIHEINYLKSEVNN